MAAAAVAILDVVHDEDRGALLFVGGLILPGFLVVPGDDVDEGALLELHLLDALAGFPEGLDREVDPPVVVLAPVVVDTLSDPKADALAPALQVDEPERRCAVVPLGYAGVCDNHF